MNEPRDDDGGLQFEQEWQQWREEEDEQQNLDAYLIALCSYYGNRQNESH